MYQTDWSLFFVVVGFSVAGFRSFSAVQFNAQPFDVGVACKAGINRVAASVHTEPDSIWITYIHFNVNCSVYIELSVASRKTGLLTHTRSNGLTLYIKGEFLHEFISYLALAVPLYIILPAHVAHGWCVHVDIHKTIWRALWWIALGRPSLTYGPPTDLTQSTRRKQGAHRNGVYI